MTTEESAGFADALIAEAINRSTDTNVVGELARAIDDLVAHSTTEPPGARWLIAVALTRLTVDLYLTGELDTDVEGCLHEALRVLKDAIDDAGR